MPKTFCCKCEGIEINDPYCTGGNIVVHHPSCTMTTPKTDKEMWGTDGKRWENIEVTFTFTDEKGQKATIEGEEADGYFRRYRNYLITSIRKEEQEKRKEAVRGAFRIERQFCVEVLTEKLHVGERDGDSFIEMSPKEIYAVLERTDEQNATDKPYLTNDDEV